MMGILDATTAWAATLVRLGAGGKARNADGRRPARPLELYEFESCPHCRRVREAISELDLTVLVHPCPKGSPRREALKARGRKAQFPYLVDPNTGTELYESLDIIRYLVDTYGDEVARRSIRTKPLPTSVMASVLRAGRGRRARPSRPAAEPLVLYSYEGSAACRPVRERLCELGLVYRLISVADGSRERAALAHKTVPHLVDPNHAVEHSGARAIVEYLESTYAA